MGPDRAAGRAPTVPGPSGRGERGAALVEFATVALLLVFIMLALVELGLLWRNALNLDQATRSGARVAANLVDDPNADREALRALVSNLDGEEFGQVQYVVVYRPDSSGQMPAGCTSGSSAVCNHYPASALTQLDDAGKWGCGAGALDTGWCPADRAPELHAPIDVGIHIEAQREWLTGLAPDALTIRSTTIMRLDPLNR